MASVQGVKGKKVLVQIGDGASPTETFAHDCFINLARSLQFNTETNSSNLPDCDPDAGPAWRTIAVTGKSATITGAGKLHTPSVETWWNWFNLSSEKTIRFKLDVSGASGGGWFQGKFVLTSWTPGDSDGTDQYADASVTLESTGAITWTDAS